MDTSPILIENPSIIESSVMTKVSAEIDGIAVWFEFPLALEIELRGEVFVAAALLEAMLTARDIHLSDSLAISSMLMNNLDTLQDIYCAWNPALHKVKVIASNINSPKKRQGEGAFFSGGIDSSYTLAKHNDTISHLIFLKGFDEEQSENEWEKVIEKHRHLAKSVNKQLIAINSNIREFINAKKISNIFQHGLTLGSIAATLGFNKIYIPSSFTYFELFPWGSHLITDPLWSNDVTQVIHDGAEAKRTAKTTYLYDHPTLLNNLQVCWRCTDSNCGTCSKCIRTSLVLYLSNKQSSSIPNLKDLAQLKTLKPTSNSGVSFLSDLADFAKDKKNKHVESRLKAYLWKYHVKYHIVELIKLLGGNYIKTWLHKVRKTQWSTARITMTTGNKNN